MGNLETALEKLSPEARAFLARPSNHRREIPYDTSRWLIVQAWCREEAKAAEWLRRFGAIVNLPTILVRVKRTDRVTPARRHKGQYELVSRPLFAGYLFIRPGELEVEIDTLPHVRGYLQMGDALAHLPSAVVEQIAQEAAATSPSLVPQANSYRPGEQVRVCDGPFSGFNGIVELLLDATLDSDLRIRLLVDLFGRACPVTLALDQVEKL